MIPDEEFNYKESNTGDRKKQLISIDSFAFLKLNFALGYALVSYYI